MRDQPPRVIVSFTHPYGRYGVGEQAGFPPALAADLVKAHVAVVVGPAAERPPRPLLTPLTAPEASP